MDIPQNAIDKIEFIRDLYDQAEDALKEIEHEAGLILPTVNQLRYCGRHLLDYFRNSKIDELDEACAHAKRAIYDAYDIAAQFYLKEVNDFLKDYKKVIFTDIVPDYRTILEDKSAAEDFLGSANSENNNREEQYPKLHQHLDNIKKHARTLNLMRPEMNKKKEQQRNTALGVWAGSLASIIAAAITIYSIFD